MRHVRFTKLRKNNERNYMNKAINPEFVEILRKVMKFSEDEN